MRGIDGFTAAAFAADDDGLGQLQGGEGGGGRGVNEVMRVWSLKGEQTLWLRCTRPRDVLKMAGKFTWVAAIALRASAVAQYMWGASARVSSCLRVAVWYCCMREGEYLRRVV